MSKAQLDQFQKSAAYSTSAKLLISAPAGSGKTRVLIERVAWLVKQQGVPQEKILVLTFAKKAAAEIRERLTAQGFELVVAKTFHAWCYRLAKTIYTQSFDLVTLNDRRYLLRELLIKYLQQESHKTKFLKELERLNWSQTYLAQEIVYIIETLQQFGWTPAKAQCLLDKNKDQSIGAWPFTKLLFKLWSDYNQLLIKNSAFDFPLLINQTCEYLQKNYIRRKIEQQKIAYLLVDEVQDANQEELNLLKLITGRVTSVTYIGDFNQAIYAWRGTTQLKWSGDQKVLKKNYRSDKKIIALVNAFMEKDTLAHSSPKQLPIYIKHKRYQEREVLARLINELHDLGYANQDILVLARAHQPLKQLVSLKKKYAGLRMETVHAVKGLEAPVVILINCSDDRFGFPLPSRSPDNPILACLATYDQSAEEKRLFYVAMTRAQERLILLGDQKRPSIFTGKLPKRFLRCVTMTV